MVLSVTLECHLNGRLFQAALAVPTQGRLTRKQGRPPHWAADAPRNESLEQEKSAHAALLFLWEVREASASRSRRSGGTGLLRSLPC